MDTIYQWLVLNVFYPAQAAVIAVSAGVDREAAFVAATASMKTKTRQVHVLWPRRVVERAQNVGIRRVFCTPISTRLQTFNSMRVGAPCCQRSISPGTSRYGAPEEIRTPDPGEDVLVLFPITSQAPRRIVSPLKFRKWKNAAAVWTLRFAFG